MFIYTCKQLTIINLQLIYLRYLIPLIISNYSIKNWTWWIKMPHYTRTIGL